MVLHICIRMKTGPQKMLDGTRSVPTSDRHTRVGPRSLHTRAVDGDSTGGMPLAGHFGVTR